MEALRRDRQWWWARVSYWEAGSARRTGRWIASLPLERIERRAGHPELLISRPWLLEGASPGVLASPGD